MTDADNEELQLASHDGGDGGAGGGEPDVLLDVSQLSVEEITLEVEDLHARVSLEAAVLELLQLHVGVDAQLGRVDLTIRGVEAKALLKARLDNVARIIERVMATIDDNPDMIERLLEVVPETVEEVGDAAQDVVEDAHEALTERPPERRRRRDPDSPRDRAAKGPRTSRRHRSEGP